MYYGNPDKIVETDNYTVFIYNKNPFDNEFEKENDQGNNFVAYFNNICYNLTNEGQSDLL